MHFACGHHRCGGRRRRIHDVRRGDQYTMLSSQPCISRLRSIVDKELIGFVGRKNFTGKPEEDQLQVKINPSQACGTRLLKPNIFASWFLRNANRTVRSWKSGGPTLLGGLWSFKKHPRLFVGVVVE